MKARGFWSLRGVSDDELVTGLTQLVGKSAWTEARLVAHLAELEARRLHLTVSRSLFAYCQEHLGLSQNEAFYRIIAARMGRKFPIVFELLEQRKLHLTALALIRDYITTENYLELLREVSGKTKEQILLLLARREPRPDTRARIRRLPVRANSIAAGPSGTLEPLSEASYRLELCISKALREKLELAADLMSHANPSRDLAIVVERALDGLIERLRKERFGQTSRPHKSARSGRDETAGNAVDEGEGAREREGDRDRDRDRDRGTACNGEGARNGGGSVERKRAWIPNELRRRLLDRDGARCSFVCDDGRPCGARAFLQVHHEAAWARGGADTLDNLRLVCAAHNRLLAEREFGAGHVARAVERRRHAG